MKIGKTIVLTCLMVVYVFGQKRTIHVFVALCDNTYQGIVPVPEKLGDGKEPNNNLYWGAAYGVKSYFKDRADEWKVAAAPTSEDGILLERLLFKYSTGDYYLLADAYDGEHIKRCIEDFLKASNGQFPVKVQYQSQTITFGGNADLIAYVGHDGLMDFDVNVQYHDIIEKAKDVIILACYSKSFFTTEIKNAKANPILWTTHLMAPEAYTLKYSLDGWLRNEDGANIVERASQSYNKYQKCGINVARKLFTTGF